MLIRPMRFQTPRSVTQTYGAPASLTIAPAAPSIPFESGAGRGAAMHAPYMPQAPTVPVQTNPNMTPFQLSLNRERAQTAQKAKSFAAASPLPMAPGQAPEQISTGGAIGSALSTALTPAPTYNGSFANAEQAQAARANYIGHQNDTINAQDLGPGIGLHSLDNANAAAHPYIDPLTQSKIDSQKAWQASQGAWQGQIAPAIANEHNANAGLKTEQGKKTANDVKQSNEMLPYQQRKTDAETGLKTAQAGAATSNAAAATERVKQTGATAQAKQQGDATKKAQDDAARPHLEKMRMLQKQMEALEKGIAARGSGDPTADTQHRVDLNNRLQEYQKQHDAAMLEYSKARGITPAPATPQPAPDPQGRKMNDGSPYTPPKYGKDAQPAPAAGGGAATQPSAQGTLRGHDPAERTPQAIADTARIHGISEDEVLRRLGVA